MFMYGSLFSVSAQTDCHNIIDVFHDTFVTKNELIKSKCLYDLKIILTNIVRLLNIIVYSEQSMFNYGQRNGYYFRQT